MTKTTLSGYIEVPEEALSEVINALPTHVQLTQQEAGCLVFKVERESENSTRFNVYEEFVDKQAFEAHQARVKASDWGKVTQNVKRFYTIIEE